MQNLMTLYLKPNSAPTKTTVFSQKSLFFKETSLSLDITGKFADADAL